MTSVHIRATAVLVALTTATVVSSCATAGREDHSVHASATSTEQVAAHDADDVQFAQLMIPHHEQAIELAAMVQWNVKPESHESGHAGMAMEGMVDDATMVKFDSLKGADFDTLWLQSKISHHQGAIGMAKTEIADGKSADLVTLAKNIVTAQQAEIDQMKQILGA